MSVIDTGVLSHQVPGGMTTNLVSQLREADALDRLHEVHEELPRVRKELGYPPLVTPTSQIVGIQAVQNVLFGRYKMISKQVKDYVYGMYGRSPAPIDPKVQKLVLKDYEKGEEPITCRAADLLEPELEKAKEATKDIAKNIGDVLIYALYPETGMRFLRWKYGQEPVPDSVKPRGLDEIKREDELIEKALSGKLVEKTERPSPTRGPRTRVYNVFVNDEYYQVEVDPGSGAPMVVQPASSPTQPGAMPSTPAEAAPAPTPASADQEKLSATDGALNAPMPGLIIRYEVEVGQKVKTGDTIVILEAMKMESALPSPVDGTVKELRLKPGDRVAKDDIIAVIDRG
jgi:pyruvate carboxylase subunit B